METDKQLDRRACAVPLLAKSLAVSLPIPVLAPVMMTVFPSSLSSDDQWLAHTLPGKTHNESSINKIVEESQKTYVDVKVFCTSFLSPATVLQIDYLIKQIFLCYSSGGR